LLANLDLSAIQIPFPVALAAVATLGYLVGCISRANRQRATARSKREGRTARCVARELEKIAWTIRRNLARHHTSVTEFKQHVDHLSSEEREEAWQELCRESEGILAPTLQLATQITSAYDQIRKQANHAITSAEGRTDPLTGVGTRQRLDEALTSQFAMMTRHGCDFSVVVLDIDRFREVNDQQGHARGDQMLQRVAGLLVDCVRETDVVVRYGGEEFAVVLPQVSLEGACVMAERCRRRLDEKLPITVSSGVASALDGDSSDSLLARAESALYSAKSAGRNCVFRHNGEQIESIFESALV
jgi:diguanylate cyclase (GGDEF)-like protein